MNATTKLPCENRNPDAGSRAPEPGATGRAPELSSASLVVQRFMVDVLGNGDVSHLSELVAPAYVCHLAHGDYYGPEGVQIDVATYRAAFPDLTIRLDDLFACGEHVIRRFSIQGTHVAPFLGHLPTGGTVILRGIGIDRVAHGQLQESWVLVEISPRAPPARS